MEGRWPQGYTPLPGPLWQIPFRDVMGQISPGKTQKFINNAIIDQNKCELGGPH